MAKRREPKERAFDVADALFGQSDTPPKPKRKKVPSGRKFTNSYKTDAMPKQSGKALADTALGLGTRGTAQEGTSAGQLADFQRYMSEGEVPKNAKEWLAKAADSMLGPAAQNKGILAALKGGRFRVNNNSVASFLTDAGIDMSKLGTKLGDSKVKIPDLGSIAKEISRINGDVAKQFPQKDAARAAFLGKMSALAETVKAATEGTPEALIAAQSGKGVAAMAKTWGSKIPGFLKGNIAKGAAGIGVGMLAGEVTDYALGAGERFEERKFKKESQSLSLEDMISEYEMQNALARRSSRMQLDFPNLMASVQGGGGGPGGQAPASQQNNGPALPGEIYLPNQASGGGDVDAAALAAAMGQ